MSMSTTCQITRYSSVIYTVCLSADKDVLKFALVLKYEGT